ncbi:gamma carbonic anhydrase family protein [Halomarina ordinaria]|uniref:Gamma carbonic anhydrase family protein n=1 Tax=Halomarina ordinaria TaxID=3033939 RepID=A0ABD5U4Z2_9EURY|nr:gamma carbonic anhydrase family protein [Halomarina sp. PSRA2]
MDSRHYHFEGDGPRIHGNAYVSREATLVGDVTVESNANVWPGAVLRGDVGPVRVGRESHVGENTAIHVSTVGERSMVASGAVLNDADVGDGVLVGFNATVNDCEVGEGSIVAAGAVVLGSTAVPPESFVSGVPASTRPLSETNLDAAGLFEAYSTGKYANLAARHEELFE